MVTVRNFSQSVVTVSAAGSASYRFESHLVPKVIMCWNDFIDPSDQDSI